MAETKRQETTPIKMWNKSNRPEKRSQKPSIMMKVIIKRKVDDFFSVRYCG